jgi:signal transduction histidine kinase
VCGALALVIAASSLLRTTVGRRHALFAAFASDVGLWYLSQSLFGFYQTEVWLRLRAVLAMLLPVLAVNLFEALVPPEDQSRHYARAGRLALLLAVPTLGLVLSPYNASPIVRGALFTYAVVMVAAGLAELSWRGRLSRSRATRRRVQFLVVIGALAGLFTIVDLGWVIGYASVYRFPPVGVVLSIVFLFVLAQALRHERLLDLYEMVGRLLSATAVAFLIAGLFYVLIAVVGQFNAMWLNAIVVAIVVLVLFNPLREWTQEQMERFVLRERGKLESSLAKARRRLAHTLDLDEMSAVVMGALDESRSVTSAALYLLIDDGSVLERKACLGDKAPPRIDVAAASALLDQLHMTPVMLEQIQRDVREGRPQPRRHVAAEAIVAAAQVLSPLDTSAVVLGVRAEEGELVGVLVVADERIGDAFSPEDIALLEQLAAQIGVVVVSSRVYAKMKERDRLAVLGQMAAGLAHEIRNPLGAIKGSAQLLAEPSPDGKEIDPGAREFVGIILEEVDRLDRVVGSVLDLARENPSAAAPIDVNAVVRRTLQVMDAEWATQNAADQANVAIDVEERLAEELPRVAVAPEQLRQVLMNLLRNASQAVSSGKGGPARRGRITIRTRLRARLAAAEDEGRWPKGAGGSPESFVVITVSDKGPGMAQGVLKNIFMPFFTTKEKGTGLGLAICQRIVQDIGGHIDVRTREGEGTSFDVVLPAAMEALGTPQPPAAVTAAQHPVQEADEAPPPPANESIPKRVEGDEPSRHANERKHPQTRRGR